MAFNINDIRSSMQYGGARPAYFMAQITNPVDGVNDFKAPFMMRTASLPESSIGSTSVDYFGRQIHLATTRTFNDWSVTIYNDEDFGIRNSFETWLSAINSHVGNINQLGASPALYKTQMLVTQYSKTGQPLRVYQFEGFPTTVGSIALDWGDGDAIETFDVEFKVDLWTVSGGVTGSGGTTS